MPINFTYFVSLAITSGLITVLIILCWNGIAWWLKKWEGWDSEIRFISIFILSLLLILIAAIVGVTVDIVNNTTKSQEKATITKDEIGDRVKILAIYGNGKSTSSVAVIQPVISQQRVCVEIDMDSGNLPVVGDEWEVEVLPGKPDRPKIKFVRLVKEK